VAHQPQAQPVVPIVAVGAVVVDPAGRVLLVLRGRPPRAGAWTLPGGRVEPGETLAQAVVREVHEETAVQADVVCELGTVTLEAEGFAYAIHEHLLVPHGDLSPRHGDDAADARWARRDELAGLGVRSEAVAVLERGVAEARSRGLIPR
jgi:8-oxo-dGTP diphosphatase